jgi:hypothetical protein
MASVYLANVTGDGQSTGTAWRPDIPVGARFVLLMLDEVAGRCVFASTDDALSGTGILLLATGASWDDLRANTRQTSPNTPRRNQINTWLTDAGYQPITSDMTWFDAVQFIARQVNPAADLDLTSVT